MAGAGYKLFNTGDVLTAAQVNTYLQEQTVMVFASSAARTTALSGVLAEGMMSYLQDTNAVQVYNGTSWVAVGGSSPLTTKGDVYTFSTVDARLGVGANGTVLTADSAEATGLKWATPASGGGMTLLNSGGTALSGASTTVSITPTGYVALKIYIKGAYSSADQRIFMRLNSDTGSNYSYTVWSNHLTNTGNLPGNGTTSFEYITRGNTTANTTLLLQNADIDLQFPNDTDFVTIQYQSIGGAAVGTFWQQSGGGVYDGTAAITGITFGVPAGTFSGGTIYVYGVK